MPLALQTQAVPAVAAKNEHYGSVKFVVAAGKTLTIETSPNAEEVYAGTVPEGAQWDVVIKVHITETNNV